MELVVGMDVHKDTVAVSLIDTTSRQGAATTVENTAAGHERLITWLSERAPTARCGMEVSGGIARGLAIALGAAGHLVVAVPPRLSSREARRLRSRGKADPSDALAVARVTAREPALPAVRTGDAEEDLKLLVDHRDQLWSERTRVANRLHADLSIAYPGYQRTVGRALTSRSSLARAEDLLRRALRADAAEGASPESLLAEETIAEIERRSAVVGPSYPIEVETSVARLGVESWGDAPAYAFLVALNARYLWDLPADLHAGARLFERLVVPALRRYWGGEAAHFGWPRDPAEHQGFQAALPRLLSQMREKLNVAPQQLPLTQKDLAVDAVAWRPLDDRPGQTVLLCQCSVGKDWSEKGVPIEKWTTLVNFAVTPTRGLAFPFLPEAVRALSEVDWLLLCAGVGVPFDRLRLAHLVGGGEVDAALLDQLRDWTATLAAALGDL